MGISEAFVVAYIEALPMATVDLGPALVWGFLVLMFGSMAWVLRAIVKAIEDMVDEDPLC